MSRVAVVLPAAGAGTRMGGVHKPLLELSGVPVLAHCLRPFLERSDVEWVVIPLPAALHRRPPAWLLGDARVRTVAGGADRSDSVRRALAAVPREADVILVHDAARPLVSAPVIGRCIAAAAGGRSVLAAVPVTDTIQQVDDDGIVIGTPDRALLRAAQTPQAFPAGVLREAHDRAAADGVSATDDAGLVVRYGGIVHVVHGDVENLKVTTQLDMLLAAAILSTRT